MKRVNKLTYVLIAVLTAAFLIFSPMYSGGVAVHAATSSVYSNVLDDLKKDSNFSESYYPEKVDDYRLQVIQLAESSDKELFVYVYQPSGQTKDFTASSINISTTINDDISYYNYKLSKCNSSGVFYKYVVKDFAVLDVATRYYEITAIYRPFVGTIDTPASDGNEITEVDYDVSKRYCFSEINGQPFVSVVDIQTIEITDKFVGYIRYYDGFKFYTSGACDSHFVAFNTDKPIDKLLEADVYYTTQSYEKRFLSDGAHESFGEESVEYAYLKHTQKVEHTGNGLFAGTYKWDRIEPISQFLAENDFSQNVYSGVLFDVSVGRYLTDEEKKILQNKKWVLRFKETPYESSYVSDQFSIQTSTLVGNVTILRLKFETDGITYNLGTIDNKQSGSSEAIGGQDTDITFNPKPDRIALIFGLLGLILFIVFCYPVLQPVLTAIVKGIVWVFTAPFKALSKLIKKKKE